MSTYMDAISANDMMMKLKPRNVQTYDQNKPANPPFTRPWVLALQLRQLQSRASGLQADHKRNSHVAWIMMVKLKVEKERNILC